MSASVVVSFLGDTKNLDQAFNKVQGNTKQAGTSIGGIAKAIGGLGLAAKGVDVVKDAFTGLRSEAEATRTLEATLQSMGRTQISTEGITKFASDLQANSDFVEEEIIAAAGVMATFGNIADTDLNKANQAAADLAARFNMDLGGATTMLGKALNDPVAGLTALGRAGVQFTDQQKDQIKAMVEAGDMAGAQGLILGELAMQTEGAAAAQQDSFEKVTDSLGELAEKGVGAVMPAFTALMDTVMLPLIGVLESVPGPVLAVAGVLAGGVGLVWAINSVSGAIKDGVVPALDLLKKHPIIFAITAIIGTLVFLQEKFDIVGKATRALGGVWDWLKDKSGAVFGWIGDRIEGFKNALGSVKDVAKGVANWVIGGYEAMANGIISGINFIIRGYNAVQRSPIGNIVPGGEVGELGKVTLPRFHAGGVVPGPPTSETLALLRGGERVMPSAGGAGGGDVHIYVEGSVVAERDLVETVRRGLGRGSGRGH